MKKDTIESSIALFEDSYLMNICDKYCIYSKKSNIRKFKRLIRNLATEFLMINDNINYCFEFICLYLEFQKDETEYINKNIFNTLIQLYTDDYIKVKNKVPFVKSKQF